MFNRKSQNGDNWQKSSPPRIGEQHPVRSKNVSVIGPTLIFKGELSADEDLVIEGTIEGSIAHHKKNLTIGKQGKVTADIHASSVIVEGELHGDIHGEALVSLAKGSTVDGNIYCDRLVIQDGACFNGRVEMTAAQALSVAPEPEELEESLEHVEEMSA